MAEYDKELQERMNVVAHGFAGRFRDSIVKVLSQPKFKNTGALASSVKVTVTPSTATSFPIINVDLLEYGDYIGLKKLLWTKLPPVDKIKKWVEQRGLASSGNIPGYKNGGANLPPEKKAERIAWAIAISKRKNDTQRQKKWKKESLPNTLRALNEATNEAFARHVETALVGSIQNK